MNPKNLGAKDFREGNMGANPYKVNTVQYRNYEFGFNQEYFKTGYTETKEDRNN